MSSSTNNKTVTHSGSQYTTGVPFQQTDKTTNPLLGSRGGETIKGNQEKQCNLFSLSVNRSSDIPPIHIYTAMMQARISCAFTRGGGGVVGPGFRSGSSREGVQKKKSKKSLREHLPSSDPQRRTMRMREYAPPSLSSFHPPPFSHFT